MFDFHTTYWCGKHSWTKNGFLYNVIICTFKRPSVQQNKEVTTWGIQRPGQLEYIVSSLLCHYYCILWSIVAIPSDQLITMICLSYLFRLLNNNHIRKLENGAFEGLDELKYLWVVNLCILRSSLIIYRDGLNEKFFHQANSCI